MSIWKRIVRIFRSRENSGSGDVDALREKLDDSYRSQLDLLQRVRRGVADVSTSRKRVEIQIAQLRQQSVQLDDAARAAVADGKDDDARAALTRSSTLDRTIASLTEQHDGLRTEESRLEDSARDIQTRIEEFRLRKDTLTARQTAAEARSQINSATVGISSSMSDVGQAISAAEKRTRELEAHADAVDELVADGIISGPGSDEHSTASFDSRFDKLIGDTDEDQQSIDRRLDALKSGTTGGEGSGQNAIQE